MRAIATCLALIALALPALAQDVAASADPAVLADAGAPAILGVPAPVTDQTLAQYQWVNRVLVIFADTPRDPSFIRQMVLLGDRPDALAERAVVVLTDTDPSAASPIRLTLRPRGFALVIVDKDGRVLQRKPSPWDVREISRTIDKTPLRQEEMRDLRAAERPLLGLPAD